jgi:methylmalonyl-CoA/ethylmalonyl-CoA epimerase
MALDKLDHIGIAVIDMEKSIPIFENLLGSPCYKTEEVGNQGVLTAFFKVGDIKIELISPIKADSTLSRYLEKKGEGIHHLAFDTQNLKQEIQELEKRGFKKIGDEPVPGADKKRIQFLHPDTTNKVLIEICEDIS